MAGDFSSWIKENMDERGWSQADLVRASGLSKQAISYYMNKSRYPSIEAVIAICKAFTLPLTAGLVALGVLEPPKDKDKLAEEAENLFEDLDPDDKTEVLSFMRYRRELGGKTKKKPKRS